MTEPLEWEDDEAHTLVVDAYDEDTPIECDVQHLPSCKWVDDEWQGQAVRSYQCAVAGTIDNMGLVESLEYSGTPLPHGPGEYRIKAWGRKDYVWDAGAYEYDAGLLLVTQEDQPSLTTTHKPAVTETKERTA